MPTKHNGSKTDNDTARYHSIRTTPDGKSVRTLTPEAARLHLKRSAEASDVKPDNGEETLPWD